MPYKLPPDPPAVTTAYQDGQISRGEIVVNYKSKHPVYWLDVYGLVDAPADQVWKAITSYDHYQDFLPLVVKLDDLFNHLAQVREMLGRLVDLHHAIASRRTAGGTVEAAKVDFERVCQLGPAFQRRAGIILPVPRHHPGTTRQQALGRGQPRAGEAEDGVSLAGEVG